jgi:hypothetical protein
VLFPGSADGLDVDDEFFHGVGQLFYFNRPSTLPMPAS